MNYSEVLAIAERQQRDAIQMLESSGVASILRMAQDASREATQVLDGSGVSDAIAILQREQREATRLLQHFEPSILDQAREYHRWREQPQPEPTIYDQIRECRRWQEQPHAEPTIYDQARTMAGTQANPKATVYDDVLEVTRATRSEADVATGIGGRFGKAVGYVLDRVIWPILVGIFLHILNRLTRNN